MLEVSEIHEPFQKQYKSESDESHLDNPSLLYLILVSQRRGLSCLPFRLGLSELQFEVLTSYLSRLVTSSSDYFDCTPAQEDLRQDLLEMRHEEWHDLRELLLENRCGKDDAEIWLANIVAAGCLGSEHLWRDLGLPDRLSLSELLERNFPKLAEANSADMKWKKFLYKQLCEKEGAYVCRAPSCEQCAVFEDCFGSEE